MASIQNSGPTGWHSGPLGLYRSTLYDAWTGWVWAVLGSTPVLKGCDFIKCCWSEKIRICKSIKFWAKILRHAWAYRTPWQPGLEPLLLSRVSETEEKRDIYSTFWMLLQSLLTRGLHWGLTHCPPATCFNVHWLVLLPASSGRPSLPHPVGVARDS